MGKAQKVTLEVGNEILIKADSVEDVMEALGKHFPTLADNEILNKKEAREFLKMKPRLFDYLVAAGIIPSEPLNPTPGEKGHKTRLFSRRQLIEFVEGKNAPSACGDND